ncbi:MAG: preprotein translocase subunit SecA [Dehalococcoidales bacterium]|nr:preprotein translocase subunit SecA [Dehalococcoidales bacterium]
MDSNEKEIDRLRPVVEKINSLEADYERLSDEELKAKTEEFKERINQATAQSRDDAGSARQALESRRKSTAEAVNNLQEQEISRECRDLEAVLQKKENDLKALEKKVLEEILPEAFAAVREAAKRTIHQRHFDVQLIGGIVLHQGKIAEMRTGEGKTLVATCPLYLNSLTGRGVHLITVNDYLARRDPYWMGPVYNALGVSVASIYPMLTPSEHTPARVYDPAHDSGDRAWKHFRTVRRREAYEADITYGTSAEFGFDHLRDNMVIDLNQCVQRPLNYGIVDEVDNLLIDEARTPLIISGAAEETADLYRAVNNVVSRMKYKTLAHEPVTYEEKEEREALKGQFDYIAYEKDHAVEDNPSAQEKLARAFNMKVEDLFGGEMEEQKQLSFEETKMRNDIRSVFRKAMQAHSLYKRDRDYVVNDQHEVVIVDEFTGRLMLGRRYSEGLHQAIEAKEGVKVQRESRTYATITIQNYFRMYQKLAGMTGTAVTEAEEFHKIYNLDVVVVPTNKPTIREDNPDRIYKDEDAKFRAVAREIEEVHNNQQPILVGTVSIEKSERLGELMRRKGIGYKILNAKEHLKEAEIIAEAGKPGSVTVATNMAGRGVDIVLGGKEPKKDEYEDPGEWEKEHALWEERHDKVLAAGGLHVIGTERHEARRIDNQLRGRSGRQGDPGSTRFYVALDDDIMKRFGGERIKSVMSWVGMDADTPIENGMVSKSIENSQIKVEGFHFDIRKHLVEFDDVVNKHRELIYAERKKVLSGADLKTNILDMLDKEIGAIMDEHIGRRTNDEWNMNGLVADLNTILPLPRDTASTLAQLNPGPMREKLNEMVRTAYDQKEQEVGDEDMRLLERLVMLRVIDDLWVEHLTEMENQRTQAGFAGLQQMKSQDSYKRIGYQQFQVLLENIRQNIARMIFHVNLRREEEKKVSTPVSRAAGVAGSAPKTAPRVAGKKVGRNDPCPCGSGKKYKHCCGK